MHNKKLLNHYVYAFNWKKGILHCIKIAVSLPPNHNSAFIKVTPLFCYKHLSGNNKSVSSPACIRAANYTLRSQTAGQVRLPLL